MPRHVRLFLPGVPCHITLRGNDRQEIVRCEGDLLRLLDELRIAAARNALAIHAYVVMTNHLHLLSTPAHAQSLAVTMQDVGRRYVSYFNKRYDRSGTLWEGRYKSALVASNAYLMNCHRYIELNPVRAGLVAVPRDYPWSSHGYYGSGRPDSLITPHSAWFELASSDECRRSAYLELTEQSLAADVLETIRNGSRSGYAIGLPADCQFLEATLGRRVTMASRGWRKGRSRGRQ